MNFTMEIYTRIDISSYRHSYVKIVRASAGAQLKYKIHDTRRARTRRRRRRVLVREGVKTSVVIACVLMRI